MYFRGEVHVLTRSCGGLFFCIFTYFVYNLSMQDIIKSLKTKTEDVKKWLSKELSGLRTGRATVTILDSVFVEAYGARSPINQVANINVEDAKTIKITAWDKSIIKSVEQAIQKADLGLSVTTNDAGVRVIFPDLTTETRQNLVKQALKKVEEAKVSTRTDRADAIKKLEQFAKDNSLSEDDVKRSKDEVQKIVDEAVRDFDATGTLKEKEILTQ
jgi:ribosome recycling factor